MRSGSFKISLVKIPNSMIRRSAKRHVLRLNVQRTARKAVGAADTTRERRKPKRATRVPVRVSAPPERKGVRRTSLPRDVKRVVPGLRNHVPSRRLPDRSVQLRPKQALIHAHRPPGLGNNAHGVPRRFVHKYIRTPASSDIGNKLRGKHNVTVHCAHPARDVRKPQFAA